MLYLFGILDLYGQNVIVENDDQPLKAIFSKPLVKAQARIQRFLLRLYPYMFTFKFAPGQDIPIADTFNSNPKQAESELNCFVHMINDQGTISKSK